MAKCSGRAYAPTQRSLPQIGRMVRSVSADSLRDERTGMSYFLIRVEVDRQALSHLGTIFSSCQACRQRFWS